MSTDEKNREAQAVERLAKAYERLTTAMREFEKKVAEMKVPGELEFTMVGDLAHATFTPEDRS